MSNHTIRVTEYRREDNATMRLVGPNLWSLTYHIPLGDTQASLCWDPQRSHWTLLDLVEGVVEADYPPSDLVQYAMPFKQAYQLLLDVELPE